MNAQVSPLSTATPPPVLRVALLARALPGSTRDPRTYALETAQALHEAGIHVHLFADPGPEIPATAFPFHPVPAPPAEPGEEVASARRFSSALVDLLGRVSRDAGGFQVVQACSWVTAPAALSLRRHGGARSAVTFLDTVFSRAGHTNGDRVTAQVRNLEQQVAREADLVLVANESVRRELAWLYGADGARVRVVPAEAVPPGHPPALRPPRQSGAGPCLGFAGEWSSEGGSDLFLDLVRALKAEQPGLRIVVAADHIAPAKLEADVRRRGLGDLLAQPAGDLDPLAACDVVVIPARSAVGYRGLYRARVAGVPVVVTRTGPAELVQPGRDGAHAFPFVASLLDEVRRILRQPLVGLPDDSFTWPKVASNLIAYYRELLVGSGEAAENLHDVARSR